MGILDIITSGAAFQEIFVLLVAWLIAITVGIVAHEFMHAWTAYKNGDITAKAMGRMTLNPIAHFDATGFLCLLLLGFGWAKGVPVNENNFRNIKKGRIWVSLSGVLINIGIGIIFSMFAVLCFYFLDTSILIWNFVSMLCYYMAAVNLFLGIFNLLPIYPLDGYNFIAAFLRYDNKFCVFMRSYGALILFIVIIFSALFPAYGLGQLMSWIMGGLMVGFSYLFFGIGG